MKTITITNENGDVLSVRKQNKESQNEEDGGTGVKTG
jgi:hypothetical protein